VWVWVLGLVVTDFCYYWAHRADHRVRLMWTAHSVHHSSEHFNLSTAIRLSWLHPVTNILRGLAWVPAALVGFPAWMIFLLQSIGLLYQFPIHTQRVETLARRSSSCSTPRRTTASTTGRICPTSIRITAACSSSGPDVRQLRRGVRADPLWPHQEHRHHNPLKVNYYELGALIRDVRDATTWRGRLGYVFGPPGWTEHPAPVVPAHAAVSQFDGPVRQVSDGAVQRAPDGVAQRADAVQLTS